MDNLYSQVAFLSKETENLCEGKRKVFIMPTSD